MTHACIYTFGPVSLWPVRTATWQQDCMPAVQRRRQRADCSDDGRRALRRANCPLAAIAPACSPNSK
eukprot:6192954-Pleurochrysis_carterae.AAC.3